MQLRLIETMGETAESTISVPEKIFDEKFNEALIHQVVVAQMAAAREGTKAQKNRAAVRGGGRKPWRQKGTGRARAGTIRSPLWRKGGVIFAASPRSFNQKVNKKMYRKAICSILSELNRQNRLTIFQTITLDQPKTKLLIEKLKQHDLLDDVLIVADNLDENLYLAARNLPNVNVCYLEDINPVNLICHKNVVFTQDAIKVVEEWLGDRAA